MLLQDLDPQFHEQLLPGCMENGSAVLEEAIAALKGQGVTQDPGLLMDYNL